MAATETIGDRVKRLRTAKSWSQYRLADESGLDHSTISKVESGGSPTRRTVRDLAAALGVPEKSLRGEI